jgi:hypothetical protein
VKAPQPAGWGILETIHQSLAVDGIGAAYISLIVPVAGAPGANAKNGVREVKFHRPFGSYLVEALNGWMKKRERFGD